MLLAAQCIAQRTIKLHLLVILYAYEECDLNKTVNTKQYFCYSQKISQRINQIYRYKIHQTSIRVRRLTSFVKLSGHFSRNKFAEFSEPVPMQFAVVRTRPQSVEICPHIDTNELLAVINHGCGGNSVLE